MGRTEEEWRGERSGREEGGGGEEGREKRKQRRKWTGGGCEMDVGRSAGTGK